jgi:hypothetical protein
MFRKLPFDNFVEVQEKNGVGANLLYLLLFLLQDILVFDIFFLFKYCIRYLQLRQIPLIIRA